MRWTCGLFFAALIAGFPSAHAEAPPAQRLFDGSCLVPECVDRAPAPFSQRLVDWTEEAREIYTIVKKLPKDTNKEIYEKYSKHAYTASRILSNSKKDIEDSYECRQNLNYLGGWIKLFYDFTTGRSKRTMGPQAVKEYQDWTEKGYLKYYQECQRYFKTLKLSPSK